MSREYKPDNWVGGETKFNNDIYNNKVETNLLMLENGKIVDKARYMAEVLVAKMAFLPCGARFYRFTRSEPSKAVVRNTGEISLANYNSGICGEYRVKMDIAAVYGGETYTDGTGTHPYPTSNHVRFYLYYDGVLQHTFDRYIEVDGLSHYYECPIPHRFTDPIKLIEIKAQVIASGTIQTVRIFDTVYLESCRQNEAIEI